MRRPGLCFRLGYLMAAIAAVGLSLGTYVEVARLRALIPIYGKRALSHAKRAQEAIDQSRDQRACLDFWTALAADRKVRAETPGAPRPDAVESWRELADQARDQAYWHARELTTWDGRARLHLAMRLKWQRAVRYPWLSVEPDPPSPDPIP